MARRTHGPFGVALAACFMFTLTFAADLPRAGAQGQGRDAFAMAEEVRTILARFQAGDDAVVLSGVEQFFAKYPVDTDTWFLLLYRAESQRRRGQLALARPDYERSLPFIEGLNNVQQRRYAFVRFRLASIYAAAGDQAAAISSLESGLGLEPQSMLHQIFLGELYGARGDRARAVKHFQDLAATAPPRSEGRVVLDIKHPNEFSEFLLKGAALCDSEIAQRDELLRRLGGPTAPIGTARSGEIARVYRAYRFD